MNKGPNALYRIRSSSTPWVLEWTPVKPIRQCHKGKIDYFTRWHSQCVPRPRKRSPGGHQYIEYIYKYACNSFLNRPFAREKKNCFSFISWVKALAAPIVSASVGIGPLLLFGFSGLKEAIDSRGSFSSSSLGVPSLALVRLVTSMTSSSSHFSPEGCPRLFVKGPSLLFFSC